MQDTDTIARTGPDPLSFAKETLPLVIDEYELQVGVQEAERAKTVFAMRQIAALHEAGAITKYTTYRFLVSLDTTAEFSPPYDTIWSDSMRQQILDFIDHIHKLVQLGARNVAREVDRTLYVLPEPPAKPGLIERLLCAIVGGNP